ncbi:hypothetical protein BJY17_000754 [Agromyces hippuratus]|uniref:Uncharacterized protein n=1 Tax=Agromyces hippuratus TaxID=286438 RepID=A0A852WQI3_9MICO|nr:hypothetical protein [Agromyces hippuratus]
MPVGAALSLFPLHAELAGELVSEQGLVQFGERDNRGVHRAAVDRAPLAIERSLHLVADHDVRVQVRIARPAVEVIERRCDHTGDVDLRNGPVAGCCTGACGRNLPLEERERLRNGSVVRMHDAFLRRCIGNAPEHARRLRNREREVISGDRATATVSALVVRVFASERVPTDRIPAHADQELELSFGDLSALGNRAGSDPWKPGTHPSAWRRALRTVVTSQRL